MNTISEIAAAAKEAGKVFNGILEQLPNHEQRAVKNFFKFLDKYNEEVTRKDSDFDTLLAYKQRKDILMEALLNEITLR